MKAKLKESFRKIIHYSDSADADLREDLNIMSEYKKYLNTELEYFSVSGGTSSAVNLALKANISFSLFNTVYTNMKIVNNNCIVLKANKKYNIKANFLTNKDSTIAVVSNNTTSYLKCSYLGVNYSSTDIDFVYEPTEDCTISFVCYSGSISIYPFYSYIVVQEIGRITTIDPVEHVNTENGIEDTPVGHIIAHMGLTAPKHYLICDGTEYNILDYPVLANHIFREFGSYNHFGGDGENTFCVPDLREKFLKGAKVSGINEEAGLPNITGEIKIRGVYSPFADNALFTHKYTTEVSGTGLNSGGSWRCSQGLGQQIYTLNASKYNPIYGNSETVTPTNTSVLYCIKYESTYFMNIFGLREEKVLFEGELSNGSAVLSDNIQNYDYLELEICYNDNRNAYKNYMQVKPKDMIHLPNEFSYLTLWTTTFAKNEFCFHFLEDNFTINIDVNNYGKITKVVGIKYRNTDKGSTSDFYQEYTDEEIETTMNEIINNLKED